jgi:hypothetical protein
VTRPVLECVDCGTRSRPAAEWRGVRVDLPDEGDEPALAFYPEVCSSATLTLRSAASRYRKPVPNGRERLG